MAEDAPQDASGPKATTPSGPPKRRLRNYLLDPRFQLRYAGMVVAVTVLVAAALGVLVYGYSRGMTEMLVMQGGAGLEMDDAVQELLEAEAAEQDRTVLLSIIGGIVLLAVALGITGIVVTHKVVGPVYKLKLLLRDVASGRLDMKGGFRRGDELQDLGDAFKEMVIALRARREDELRELEGALEAARESDASEGVIERLESLRDRLRATLAD